MKFSVLMSTYYKENAEYLSMALESLKKQTLPADEIVIVKDGPLTTELDKVIEDYSNTLAIKIIALEINKGLGNALRIGIEACSYDIIARMDSDDISSEDRFEKQLTFLQNNPEIDIVGSWISEFEGEPDNIYAYRELPVLHDDMIKFAKRRNPLNHMTVMYKKSAVLKAGNYSNIKFAQDYHLWVRMFLSNSRFANIPQYFVNVRAGEDMLVRRSGIVYAKNEFELQKEFLRLGFLNRRNFFYNTLLRIPLRFMPNWLIKLVYSFLRGTK